MLTPVHLGANRFMLKSPLQPVNLEPEQLQV